jgi:hypothetical protein
MTLPTFNAEQSLYRSSRHYRASALASVVGGIRPSDTPPTGSYQDSCFRCMYYGQPFDVLSCACPDVNGCGRFASFSPIMSICGGFDIYNNNGHLGCRGLCDDSNGNLVNC